MSAQMSVVGPPPLDLESAGQVTDGQNKRSRFAKSVLVVLGVTVGITIGVVGGYAAGVNASQPAVNAAIDPVTAAMHSDADPETAFFKFAAELGEKEMENAQQTGMKPNFFGGISKWLQCQSTPEYVLRKVASADLPTEMVYPTRANNPLGLPDVLLGLFWMDGNPVPDEVIGFGNAYAGSEQRNFHVPVYGNNSWSWHADFAGKTAFEGILKSKMTYEFTFNEDYSEGLIEPRLSLLFVPNGYIVDFKMLRLSDDIWDRPSRFFGGAPFSYTLRRIVDADGNKIEPAFQNFLEKNKGGPTAALSTKNPEYVRLGCDAS